MSLSSVGAALEQTFVTVRLVFNSDSIVLRGLMREERCNKAQFPSKRGIKRQTQWAKRHLYR